LRFIGFSFGFLFGPLLYLYTKSLTKKEFTLSKKDFLHIIPFLIYNIIMLLSYHLLGSSEKVYLLQNSLVLPRLVSNVIMLSLHIQILIYISLAIRLLINYGKELKKIFSSIERLNLSWLMIILFGFIFMWAIDLTHFLLLRTVKLPVSIYNVMNFFSLSTNFVFAFLIVYKALKNPELFYELTEQTDKVKYEKSALTKGESIEYLNRLKNFMIEEKPYLEPDLTITDLASKINIPSKTLSQVINENLNQNFFDFVNSYRIAEAKEMLSALERKITVLEVLYSVGFNSKSAFNSAFRRHTGLTPTEYKRRTNKEISSVFRGKINLQ
jgi:AraC-like DNA-binding protein